MLVVDSKILFDPKVDHQVTLRPWVGWFGFLRRGLVTGVHLWSQVIWVVDAVLV